MIALLTLAGCWLGAAEVDRKINGDDPDYGDATGLTVALGEVARLDYVGDYWGTDGDNAYARVGFTEPTGIRWRDLVAGGLESCEGAASWDDVTWLETGLDEIVLEPQSGKPSQTLAAADGEFVAEFPTADFPLKDDWTLFTDGTDTWPETMVEGFVRTPSAIQVDEPVLDGNTVQDIARSDFDLLWNEIDSGDYVVIELRRLEGDEVVDVVVCLAEDDGGFRVDNAWFTGWDPGDYLYVYVGRVLESGAVLPHDNGDAEVVGVAWTIGALRQD